MGPARTAEANEVVNSGSRREGAGREIASHRSVAGNSYRVGRVHGDLVLRGIADQTLSVVEGDVRRGGAVTLVVGNDLDTKRKEGICGGICGGICEWVASNARLCVREIVKSVAGLIAVDLPHIRMCIAALSSLFPG